MTGFIFGWTTPLWEKYIFFITSCRLLSSLMQYSANNTHWPSACRNGITCIRFCQILLFSVQIPPLLLYFVCVWSGIRAVVLFLAPACVSTVGAVIQWCRRYSMVQLHGASFSFSPGLNSASGSARLRSHCNCVIFFLGGFHLLSETLYHGDMQCGSCYFFTSISGQNLGSIDFLKMNMFIQKGCIKLSKCDNKDNVTKVLYSISNKCCTFEHSIL